MSETTTPYVPGKHGPIRIDTRKKATAAQLERETFLMLDDSKTGETTEVTILKTVLPSQGLKFITLVRDLGETRAVAQIFDEVIEPKGVLDRLAKIEGITQGEIDTIMTVVADKLLAAAQAASGNSDAE